MTSVSHALIGAAIASRLPNPVIGLPLAFISHFIADIIPHWDFAINRRLKSNRRFFFEAGFDVLLGFGIVWYIFAEVSVNPLYLFSSIIAAQLPDWVDTFLPLVFRYRGYPVMTCRNIQRSLHWKLGLPWGLALQLVIVLCFLIALGILPFPSFYLLAK